MNDNHAENKEVVVELNNLIAELSKEVWKNNQFGWVKANDNNGNKEDIIQEYQE